MIRTCWATSAGHVLIAEVSTVIVTIASPVVWDTTTTGALELGVGARLDASHFITAISTVIIYTHAQTLMKGVTTQTNKNIRADKCKVRINRQNQWWWQFELHDLQTVPGLTWIAVPLHTDTSSIWTAELGEGLTGGEGWKGLNKGKSSPGHSEYLYNINMHVVTVYCMWWLHYCSISN